MSGTFDGRIECSEAPRPGWRVFLSHTSELRDSPRQRSFVAAAEAAVSRAGSAVADLVYARGTSSHCAGALAEADVYVGIIGFRYGSPVRDDPDKSRTELEFEAALRLGLHRLVFLLDESKPLPLPAHDLIDLRYGDRQRHFRQRLRQHGRAIPVSSPTELETRLYNELLDLTWPHDEAPPSAFGPPEPADGAIGRPELASSVAALLCTPGLVGLLGEGGFGKSMLAAQVCGSLADRFPDGISWVRLGKRVTGSELATRLDTLAEHLSGRQLSHVDPQQAGTHLGRVLGTDRRLLVIDDVWRADQLLPFLSGAPNTTRLVTTRSRLALPEHARIVPVEGMTDDEAAAVLTQGLTGDQRIPAELLKGAGGWPLLLRLVNRVLRRWMRRGASLSDAVRQTAGEAAGPGRDGRLAAALAASLRALAAGDRRFVDRCEELAVFPDDVDVPLAAIQRLWWETGGMDGEASERLAADLADLSLVQGRTHGAAGGLRLLEPIAAALRQRAAARLPAVHRSLLRAHRRLLPPAAPAGSGTAWWEMGDEPYLWDQLTYHLHEAGREDGSERAELTALVCDLRWIVARLERGRPAAVDADLARACGPRAAALRRALAASAGVLGPLDPPHALGATLLSRLASEPELAAVTGAYSSWFPHRRLAPAVALPDGPAPRSSRLLTGHTDGVNAVAVSADGAWFASGGSDGSVRVWSSDDCFPIAVLLRHDGVVRAVAISPDGAWLATAGDDATVRLWDAGATTERRVLAGHTGRVTALAVSPDGRWLASAGDDGTILVWDPGTGELRSRFCRDAQPVLALAAGPDGAWLASAGWGRVRIWDLETGTARVELPRAVGLVWALAASPDGAWLATTGADRAIRLWRTADGEPLGSLPAGPGPAWALAFSPDGSWLASAGDEPEVRIWDPSDGSLRETLAGHSGPVRALAAGPGGTWLVSAGLDRTVRRWTIGSDQQGHERPYRSEPVRALAASPDGSWLAEADEGGEVRIWDATSGLLRVTLRHDPGSVDVLAAGAYGSWLVTAGVEGAMRIWDTVTGRCRTLIEGGAGAIRALVVAPDGSWLASAYDDRIVLLDPVTGEVRGRLSGRARRVMALAVSADGRVLATAGDDGTVRLWDAATASLRSVRRGHEASVLALAVTPDGGCVASAGLDGSLRLWNAARCERPAVLQDHGAPVRALAISPDGRWLASAGDDSTVRLWDVRTGACATALRVTAPLTAAAWLRPARLGVAGARGLYVLDVC
jgi:WD40 repeat protein